MNKELTNIFNQNLGVQNFNSLKIHNTEKHLMSRWYMSNILHLHNFKKNK